MQGQATTLGEVADDLAGKGIPAQVRDDARELALQSALRKRSAGVPTYTIPEAAALLSVSREHLYRLVRADSFPVVRMCTEAGNGRYVVPADAIEHLLARASRTGAGVGVAEWSETWRTSTENLAGSVGGGLV